MLNFENKNQFKKYINNLKSEKEMYWHSKNRINREERVKTNIEDFAFEVNGYSFRLRGVKYNKPKQSSLYLYNEKSKIQYNLGSIEKVWDSILQAIHFDKLDKEEEKREKIKKIGFICGEIEGIEFEKTYLKLDKGTDRSQHYLILNESDVIWIFAKKRNGYKQVSEDDLLKSHNGLSNVAREHFLRIKEDIKEFKIASMD